MQPNRIQDIKNLVFNSTILNPKERSEWLTLLDLMNDKQLSELEIILSNKKTSAAAAVSRPEVNSFAQSAARPQTQIPKLSHIMNLPNLQSGGFASQPSAAMPPIAAKQNSGFAQRLKSLLSEKELTAGKPELELPAGNNQQTVSKSQPAPSASAPQHLPVAKPFEDLPPVPRPKPKIVEAPKKMPAIAPAPVRTFAPELLNKPKVTLPQVLASSPNVNLAPAKVAVDKFSPPTAPQKPFIPPVIKPLAPVNSAGLKDNQNFAAGINFPKVSATAQADILSKLKQHVKESGLPGLSQAGFAKPSSGNLPGMDDLTSLDPKSFDNNPLDALTFKTRNLIASYGYHDVLFNIEKSPLYESYIQTGLELLNKQVDFTELRPKPGINYLTREQFEKFTDYLTAIQTG